MGSRILLLLFTVVFAAQLGVGLISPLLPIYAQSMGATGLWLGIIASVFAFARFVVMPFIGRYSDVHGRRRLIIFGLAAYAALSLGYVAAGTPESLTLVRFAHGVSSALIVPVAMAYMGDLAPKGREGRYMGLFHTAMFLGVGFGPLLGGVLADFLSMEYAFISMGLIALVNLIFVIAVLPESTETRRGIEPAPYREVLANRVVLAVVAYRMSNALGQGVVMAFLPIYAVGELGLPLSLVGLILSSRMFTLSVLQGPSGILSDRYNRVGMTLAGGTIFFIALLAMPMAEDLAQLLAINIIGATGTAISIAATSAITTNLGRDFGMGTMMGLMSAAMAMGMATGPIIGGLIYDTFGLSELFYIGGACAAVGVVSFSVLMRRSYSGQGTGPKNI